MKRAVRKTQRGAVAIEFAMLFAVFFVVVYGIIAYSIPMLLLLTFKQVSADAARATLQADGEPMNRAPVCAQTAGASRTWSWRTRGRGN